jgi:hypothetical protein
MQHRVYGQVACAADSWGGIVGSVGSTNPWTCANYQPKKILEIFLQFGASLWETFWLSGTSTGPDFAAHGLDEFDKPTYPSDARFADLTWDPNGSPCFASDMPSSRLDSNLFGTASDGEKIYWGASTKPLYLRSDILSRARLVTQYHDLAPHDAAIPYSVTGLKRGNPRFAGTGAAIQRRALAIDPSRQLPASFILHSHSDLYAEFLAAVGVHPGYARPVVIRVQDTDAFYTALGRTGITSDSDRLLSALRYEFRDRLRFQGAGDPIRSAGFASYWAAAELLAQSQPLQALFANQVLVIDRSIAVCTRQNPQARQAPAEPSLKTMLNAAATLLTSPGGAEYVGIIDTGLANSYDTHLKDHLLTTNANFYNLSYYLAHLIKHPINNPSGLIDLDETMILVSSEFGRTNGINSQNFGRDHWPYGYAGLLIGGPIPPSTTGGSILGAIGKGDGITAPLYRYSPTDIRGAMLLAAGVDPFAPGNFRFSDFSDVVQYGISTEAAIRDRLRRDILGA